MRKITCGFCSAAILFSSATTLVLAQQADQPQKSEQSQQELKVTDQEMKQQVTDANKASKLIGMKVKNRQDEDLGKISELVVDYQSGKIAYAVLSSGGILGLGNKMVAVPFQAFTLKPGEKALVLDLNKQQLSQAAGFTDQNWPDLNAAEKGQTVGLAPSRSREIEAAGGTSSQSEQAKGRASGSITNLQQVSADSDPSMLDGRRVNISAAKVDEALGQNLISVSSDSGQKLLVRSRQAVHIQAGQKVNVTGILRKMPSDVTQLGLDQQGVQKFQGQKLYIEATGVTPAAE